MKDCTVRSIQAPLYGSLGSIELIFLLGFIIFGRWEVILLANKNTDI